MLYSTVCVCVRAVAAAGGGARRLGFVDGGPITTTNSVHLYTQRRRVDGWMGEALHLFFSSCSLLLLAVALG